MAKIKINGKEIELELTQWGNEVALEATSENGLNQILLLFEDGEIFKVNGISKKLGFKLNKHEQVKINK